MGSPAGRAYVHDGHLCLAGLSLGNVLVTLQPPRGYGMDPQAALDCARVFYDAGALEAERGIPAASIKGLRAKGHKVVEAPEALGGGQAIRIDWKAGTLTAGFWLVARRAD